MRNIVFMMSVSVDGFMAGPDGELDWHLVDDS
jgi:dihydrofolate reductase